MRAGELDANVQVTLSDLLLSLNCRFEQLVDCFAGLLLSIQLLAHYRDIDLLMRCRRLGVECKLYRSRNGGHENGNERIGQFSGSFGHRIVDAPR